MPSKRNRTVATLKVWIARDMSGDLAAYTVAPPTRSKVQWECTPDPKTDTEFFALPKEACPQLRWEDEPLEAEVTVEYPR